VEEGRTPNSFGRKKQEAYKGRRKIQKKRPPQIDRTWVGRTQI
jgi:hypothetical protein